MNREDRDDDQFILSVRAEMFVSYLNDGHDGDEADRLAEQAERRAEDKSGRTGKPREFQW